MSDHDNDDDGHDLDGRPCLCMECCERRGEIGDLDDGQDEDDYDDQDEDEGESAIEYANRQERAMKAMGF